MFSVWIILAAIACYCFSGVPACFLSSRSAAGQRIASALMVTGSVLGLYGTVASVFSGISYSLRMPWVLPCGQFAITIDPISVLFLGLVFVVPTLGSIYGLGYWKQSEHHKNGCRLGFFYGLLTGSMAMVVIARDGILFLIAWEVMAIAAYFAATVEEEDPVVRRAGWVYLIATHMGTLCLMAMFALWRHATGSFFLEQAAIPAGLAGVIFVLGLIGFGFKAGIMPVHVWLPGAHANAPSHVSAVMSGVMLKMGVYGIVRMTMLLPTPEEWWGGALLITGTITGVVGIAFAIGQHDLKRLLAYSSIENIGIIVIGLGLALIGRSLGRADWILMGLGGAFLHVWNHGLFKSLLFFDAGAIIHAVHTREMDRLGGLAKRMPRMTALFILGAVAICALPPLNGFVSEWLIYVGLFRTLGIGGGTAFPAAAVTVVPIALIGALAIACFMKLTGTVFLGSPRTDAIHYAHDPQPCMTIPMVVLAAGCICIGLFPMLTVPLLEKATRTWATISAPEITSISTMVPLRWITLMGLILLAVMGSFLLIVRKVRQTKISGVVGTWDCGYSQPTSRMQYTGSSLGRTLVDQFAFVLWPKKYFTSVQGLFPIRAHFKSLVPDVILDRLVLPLFHAAGRYLPLLRVFQQGQTQVYVLYILGILIVLLVWGILEVQL